MDYRYNIRGWLTDINNIDTLSIGSNPEDLFAFKINYNKSYHNEFAVPALYNGNISETLWVSSTDNVQRKYNYQYDNLNRLRYARYEKPQGIGITDMYDEQVDYDKNGNIQHLNRNGDFDADDELHIFTIDQLNYTYDTDNKNRLMRVEDTTTSTLGFKDDNTTGSDPDDDYTYDDFGNMLSDTNKKIDSISYNHLNLPIRIIFAGGNKIQYLYNAAGQKVRKTVTKSSTDTVTDYQDGFQYADSKLSFFNHAEGYVNVLYCNECEVKTRYNYVFNYLDHLGNIRMSYAVDPDDNILKILEENHYYPFGLKHTNYNSGAKGFEKKEGEPEKTTIEEISPFENPFYKYKFQGQERQDELGLNWDSFKWRNYDYAIGRFMSIDPLTEDYEDYTPYQFSSNQPVHAQEVEGLENSHDLNKINLRESRTIVSDATKTTSSEFRGVKPRIASNYFDPGTLSYKIGAAFVNGMDNVGALGAIVDGEKPGTLDQNMSHVQSGMLFIVDNSLFIEGVTSINSAPSDGEFSPSYSTEVSTEAESGLIYKVPGEGTESGKPYIGRTKQESPEIRGKGATDGRDRSKATVIDKYNPNRAKEGSYKEQRAMNNHGGVKNLDNKRNEMSKKNYEAYEKKNRNGG